MATEKGRARYVRINPGKRTREMAAIARNRKFKANGQGDAEPGEKVTWFSGTAAAGRLKLYEKLEADDKAAPDAGNMAFIMAKETGKTAGARRGS
jgi:hypothetical protein